MVFFIVTLGGRIKEQKVRMAEAKLALSRTQIMAPINGRLNEIKDRLTGTSPEEDETF